MSDESAISKTPILIVAAVDAEVRSLIATPSHNKLTPSNQKTGWPVYNINPHVTIVLSGIGRANAAGATAYALTNNQNQNQSKYQAVINVGIAGALPGSNLQLGDIVIASESVFYEEGIDLPEGPRDLQTLGFGLIEPECNWVSGNRIYGTETLIEKIKSIIPGKLNAARNSIATVARCSGTDKAAQSVARMTGSVAEAMEGAAVVFVARRLGIPAVEIRVISNTCGERAQQNWDMQKALLQLDEVLNLIINTL